VASAPPAGTPPPAEPPPAGRWSETWRDDMAKGNEKARKVLDRYASPEAVAEALMHARDKIASGQTRQPLKADASPEEVAEYRAANDVPATPAEYDTSLPDGLVIGEADKPLIEGFLKHAHDNNLPKNVVKQNLAWYYSEQNRQAEAQYQRDAEGKKAVEADLREEFGGEYKRYVKVADEFMLQGGEEFRDALMQARMPDGTLVGANPTAIRWLVNTALSINPLATVTPAANSTSLATAQTELAGLIKESGDRKGPYWAKDAVGAAKRARHMELNKMLEKMPKK
jgi:hypothetical protein